MDFVAVLSSGASPVVSLSASDPVRAEAGQCAARCTDLECASTGQEASQCCQIAGFDAVRDVSLARLEPAFRQLLADEALEFVFQPIVDMRDALIYGYEALMRGPDGSPLKAPDVLLRLARSTANCLRLEEAAVFGAIRGFGADARPGRLFVNVSAPTICALARDRGNALFKVAVEAGVAPSRLMFELTEHERVRNPECLKAALDVFSAQGVGLALDDFGDGRSSLRLWTELQPDIVKLDKYFVRGIHRDRRKVDVLHAIQGLAERLGALLVAEGIEEGAELAVLRDLGCVYAQGFYLGRPCATPCAEIVPEAAAVLVSEKISVLPTNVPRPDFGQTVERLLVQAPPLASSASNEEAHQRFMSHPELHAVAVVDGGYPVGLLNRRTFLDGYAQRFFHELFGKRSCTLLMNATPFRVEKSVLLDSMVRMLAGDDQRYLFEGFIITDGGRYAGLATGESLVRAVTERRVEAARHANPLTLLPGNIPITEHIRRLLEARGRFAACYFDLNNFKPFNDLYGYWRGDEMIKLAAEVVSSHCDPEQDFVGHVGGDDFVVLFQSEDWAARCRRVLAEFSIRARSLFNREDLARNGFESEDRHGFRRFFPLTGMAVGAVLVEPGAYATAEEVASAAAAAKKLAKESEDGFHAARAGEV